LPDPEKGTSFWDDKKDSGKWGIDDFTVYFGSQALQEFLQDDDFIADIQISPLQQHIDELNSNYSVVIDPPGIVDLSTDRIIKVAEFKGLLEAHRVVFMDDAKGNPKPVSAAEQWLKTEERTTVRKLVYRPGAPRFKEGSYVNVWQDTGVEPVEGDISPFLKVYKNAIPNQVERQLLLESMAWILQNRGERLEKTFMLIGSQVGTGKSLLVNTFGKCVGTSNYVSIGVEDFTNDFNSVFVNKEVILMDDMIRLPAAQMGKLRRYITDETVVVNPKGVQQYSVENFGVYFMTANEWSALTLDDNERRVLACHLPQYLPEFSLTSFFTASADHSPSLLRTIQKRSAPPFVLIALPPLALKNLCANALPHAICSDLPASLSSPPL